MIDWLNLFSVVHNDPMESCHVLLAQLLPTIKSLSNNTKTRFAASILEMLYENISLTEILSSLKVAKKHVYVYCCRGKHFTCWDLHGMLQTDKYKL